MDSIEITFPKEIAQDRFGNLLFRAIKNSYPDAQQEHYKIEFKGTYKGENLYSVTCAYPDQFYKVGFIVAILMGSLPK